MTKMVDEIVTRLAGDLKPAVEAIEASTPMTQGHYGKYMAIFSQFADDVGQARVLALALIEAGGNKQGVNDALKVSF